ncbi:helix-turn-helix domain-containing protein [Curtobacterium sp. GD1]|uniref:helix-turn-helix domain-containing protein n=1 Tax=Curtobacterium sp. GD1 TaxID=2810612 RepID=UPI0035B30C8E
MGARDDGRAQRAVDVGAALLKARKKIPNMTRRELASRTGVNPSTIQKIEHGDVANPGVFTLALLAVELRVDISDALRSLTGRIVARPMSDRPDPRPARALRVSDEGGARSVAGGEYDGSQ